MKNLNFKFLIKVVTWTLLVYDKEGSVSLQSLITLIKDLEIKYKSRGPDWYILYVKSLRSNLSNYLSGNPIRDPLSKVTKDGIPVIFKDLIASVRGKSYLAIAMIYTVLFATRSLKRGKGLNVDSIIQPWKGDVTNLTHSIPSFWKDLGYNRTSTIPRSLSVNLKSYRSKSGPNGHALVSSYLDAMALPEDLVDQLSFMGGEPMKRYLENTRNYALVSWIKTKFKSLSKEEIYFRRLSSFKDKENKIRVVGILDWFSQLTLKPLHLYLMKALSKIPQDCTLDQTKFVKLLDKAPIYYSVDLSNATDRFPIKLICRVLKGQLPTGYVDNWEKVMVGHPFWEPKSKEFISYSTGNPMGAYSSFNSFALTHHYIIYHCCKTLGISWKKLPYALLGDDIVIGDKEVAELYLSILSQLDVPVSKSKTHVSTCFYEFAKRIFYKGKEVTPFPYSALNECKKSPEMMTTLLFEQSRIKKWVPKVGVVSSVQEFYRVAMNWRRPYIKSKVFENSWFTLGVLYAVHGYSSASDFINEIIRFRGYRLPVLSEEVSKNIFLNTIVDAFSESNIMKSVTSILEDIPLTRLTFEWMFQFQKYLMNYRFESPVLVPNVDFPNTPIPLAALAVMEEYSKLQEQVQELDRTGSDWSYGLRTFALPRSDKSILDKGNYVISKAAKSFGSKIDDQLNILQMYPQLLN